MFTIPTVSLVLGTLFAASVASPLNTSPADMGNLFKRISSGCSTTGSASCHNTTVQSNSCCFEAPGGLLLQTQFWDTSPSTGPSNSWTIHGLWGDNCDLTYSENCDSSRAYTDIAGLLTAAGATDTLNYMQTYWVDINGANEKFWEHEWSTHGTCYSTLKTACLPSGSTKGAEAVSFFQTVVALFKTLPTYQWLAAAGITPSSTTTHTLASLNAALKAGAGVTPALTCTSSKLGAISWYFNLKGSLLDGKFVPIDAPASGSCPSTGIIYPTKTGSAVTTATGTTTKTTTTATTTTTGAAGSFPTKGTITGVSSGSTVGGLLSAGTWSTQTLATYTFSGTASSFTMTTSKGSCGVSSGTFSCGSSVTASTFSLVTSGSNTLLAYSGSTAWTSDAVPSGSVQQTVYTGSGHASDYTLAVVAS